MFAPLVLMKPLESIAGRKRCASIPPLASEALWAAAGWAKRPKTRTHTNPKTGVPPGWRDMFPTSPLGCEKQALRGSQPVMGFLEVSNASHLSAPTPTLAVRPSMTLPFEHLAVRLGSPRCRKALHVGRH